MKEQDGKLLMIDFHQHLNDPKNPGQELFTTNLSDDLCALLHDHEKKMTRLGFEKVNVIFNCPAFFLSKAVEEQICRYLRNGNGKMLFTFMVDPMTPRSAQRIEELPGRCGPVLGIKFHSAFQELDDSKYDRVVEIAEIASKQNMFVMVDGSYGVSNIYKYDNLELLGLLCDRITTPIIFAHGGALKVKEALLLALEYPHLYFDSSFTLAYWKGSSVEQDFAFVTKKLGGNRVLFGSDYPYSDIGKELELQNAFLEFNKVEKEDRSLFFGVGARKVISRLTVS